MAHDGDVRLVEAAASVMGVAIPLLADDEQDDGQDGGRTASRTVTRAAASRYGSPGRRERVKPELERAPDARGAGRDRCRRVEAGAIQQGGEAAQLVAELLAGQEVAAVTMFRAAPDGSLRLLGQQGVPWEEIGPWRSIPPSP